MFSSPVAETCCSPGLRSAIRTWITCDRRPWEPTLPCPRPWLCPLTVSRTEDTLPGASRHRTVSLYLPSPLPSGDVTPWPCYAPPLPPHSPPPPEPMVVAKEGMPSVGSTRDWDVDIPGEAFPTYDIVDIRFFYVVKNIFYNLTLFFINTGRSTGIDRTCALKIAFLLHFSIAIKWQVWICLVIKIFQLVDNNKIESCLFRLAKMAASPDNFLRIRRLGDLNKVMSFWNWSVIKYMRTAIPIINHS